MKIGEGVLVVLLTGLIGYGSKWTISEPQFLLYIITYFIIILLISK